MWHVFACVKTNAAVLLEFVQGLWTVDARHAARRMVPRRILITFYCRRQLYPYSSVRPGRILLVNMPRAGSYYSNYYFYTNFELRSPMCNEQIQMHTLYETRFRKPTTINVHVQTSYSPTSYNVNDQRVHSRLSAVQL